MRAKCVRDGSKRALLPEGRTTAVKVLEAQAQSQQDNLKKRKLFRIIKIIKRLRNAHKSYMLLSLSLKNDFLF